MARVPTARRSIAAGIVMAAGIFGGAASGLLGVCGPFTDVAADSFCAFVFEVFTLGITTGTTPTTYEPASAVSRLQMAAFLSRGVDGVLKRGSRRAALRQYWTIQGQANLGLTAVGLGPQAVESDGLDIWVANSLSGTVSRVRGSDGRLLETWTGAANTQGVLSAMGRVFASSRENPGKLYRIDPSQPAGAVTTVASNLGVNPQAIAFDGSRIWSANSGLASGSVSLATPGATIPWTVSTVTVGFSSPEAILYDGANIWITDQSPGTLLKLNANGVVLQTITVGSSPSAPGFDGSNIWVPSTDDATITVVRASNGAVLATLTGNGLSNPRAVAFDGQRVLVVNLANSVSLWKAADLTTIGSFATGADTNPRSACSDGVNFWIALYGSGQLARF